MRYGKFLPEIRACSDHEAKFFHVYEQSFIIGAFSPDNPSNISLRHIASQTSAPLDNHSQSARLQYHERQVQNTPLTSH
jgi:hypothetical protein